MPITLLGAELMCCSTALSLCYIGLVLTVIYSVMLCSICLHLMVSVGRGLGWRDMRKKKVVAPPPGVWPRRAPTAGPQQLHLEVLPQRAPATGPRRLGVLPRMAPASEPARGVNTKGAVANG